MKASSQRLAAFAERARQDEDRIGTAHLGIDRYRLLTRSREVHERSSSFERASKTNCANQRMTHELRSHACAGVEEQGKCAGREFA